MAETTAMREESIPPKRLLITEYHPFIRKKDHLSSKGCQRFGKWKLPAELPESMEPG